MLKVIAVLVLFALSYVTVSTPDAQGIVLHQEQLSLNADGCCGPDPYPKPPVSNQ